MNQQSQGDHNGNSSTTKAKAGNKSQHVYKCPEKGCSFETKTDKETITDHLNFKHLRQYTLNCTQKDCPFTCFTRRGMLDHYKHKHPKWAKFEGEFKCGESGCSYSSTQKHALIDHINAYHTRSVKYICKREGCKFETFTRGSMLHHQRSKHPDNKNCEKITYHRIDLKAEKPSTSDSSESPMDDSLAPLPSLTSFALSSSSPLPSSSNAATPKQTPVIPPPPQTLTTSVTPVTKTSRSSSKSDPKVPAPPKTTSGPETIIVYK